MDGEDQEELERVRDWVERLEAFASTFDDNEGHTATDFANNALEALQAVVMPHVVASRTPAMLLALEAVVAVTQATTDVIMDWADTPDVRDRYTRETAQSHLKAALDGMLSSCRRWLSEGFPAKDEVQQRIASAAKQMKEAMELLGSSPPNWRHRTQRPKRTRTARFWSTWTPAALMRQFSRRCVR